MLILWNKIINDMMSFYDTILYDNKLVVVVLIYFIEYLICSNTEIEFLNQRKGVISNKIKKRKDEEGKENRKFGNRNRNRLMVIVMALVKKLSCGVSVK